MTDGDTGRDRLPDLAASAEFEDLIPGWLFCLRGRARYVAAVVVPLVAAVPLMVADNGPALRMAPILVAGMVLVAGLAGTWPAAVAGLITVILYWWNGVAPARSFALDGMSSTVALGAMTLMAAAMPALTKRIENTVSAVRRLDADRRRAVLDERRAREDAEVLAGQSMAGVELAVALGSARSMTEVADRALDHLVVPAMPTDCSIALVVENHLVILASRGSNPKMIAALEAAPLDQTRWLASVLAGSPLFVDDREDFARTHPDARILRLYRTGSWAAVPFRFGTSIGLLSVHFAEPQRLSAQRQHFTLLAELIANALERAAAEERDAAQLEDIQRALAERDRIARTLSTTLLPPRLPQLDGFMAAGWLRPASGGDVAGDFYDLFAVGPQEWVATLGDVCGKGAEAAAVTSLSRYAARATALVDPDPAHVADVANRALNEDTSELFCTMACVHYTAGAIDVTLAGHPPARLLTASGVVRIGTSQIALGIADAEYRSEHHEFGPGDTVLLFSDGLTERNAKLDEDALDAALASWTGCSPHDLLGRLRELIDATPPEHADDIALLAVTRVR